MFEDDFDLFDEMEQAEQEYVSKVVWEYIKNNDLKGLKNYIKGLEQSNEYFDIQLLHFKAIYSYLKGEKKSKDLMIEALIKEKEEEFVRLYDYEIMIYLVDKLKTFYSKKDILNRLSANIIKRSIELKQVEFYHEAFEVVCESGFYLIENNNLDEANKLKLYAILFRFLHMVKIENLDKELYQKYLRYYFMLLWELRYEYKDLAKKMFLPFFQGAVYKSMALDSDEEKIAKIMNYGIEKYIAEDIVKFVSPVKEEETTTDDIPF